MAVGRHHVRQALSAELLGEAPNARRPTRAHQGIGVDLEQNTLRHQLAQRVGIALKVGGSLRVAEGDPQSASAQLVQHPVETENASGRRLDQKVGATLPIRGEP